MFINFKTLKNIPVETANGIALGFVVDLDLNIETHEVVKYLVAEKKLLTATNKLLIAPNQIIKITNEKIIVQNSSVEVAKKSPLTMPQLSPDNPITINSERTN